MKPLDGLLCLASAGERVVMRTPSRHFICVFNITGHLFEADLWVKNRFGERQMAQLLFRFYDVSMISFSRGSPHHRYP